MRKEIAAYAVDFDRAAGGLRARRTVGLADLDIAAGRVEVQPAADRGDRHVAAGRPRVDRAFDIAKVEVAAGCAGPNLAQQVADLDVAARCREIEVVLRRHRDDEGGVDVVRPVEPAGGTVILGPNRDIISLLIEGHDEITHGFFASGAAFHIDGHAGSAAGDAHVADVSLQSERAAGRDVEGLVNRTLDRRPGGDAERGDDDGGSRSDAVHGALRTLLRRGKQKVSGMLNSAVRWPSMMRSSRPRCPISPAE